MVYTMRERRLLLLIPAVYGLAFFLGLESGGFQFALFRVASDFALNEVMMGVLVASQFTSITIAPLIFGHVSDKIGKKPALLIFIPVFSGGCFLAASAPSTIPFISGVFLIGLGYSVCECIGSSALSDSFPGKESRHLNMMQCSFSLGAVISPLLFKQLIMGWGFSWRLVFLVSGCGFLLLYPFMLLSGCRKPEQAIETSKSSILKSPFFLALLFCMLAYVSMETGLAFFADTFMTREYSLTLGAYGISLFWFAMAVSRFFFAWLKIGKHDAACLGFGGSAVFLLLFLFIKNQWLVLGIYAVLGFLMGPIWPMILGIGISAYKEKSGLAAGLLYAGGGVGGIISPVIIGLIAGRAGFYGGFVFLSLFAVSALPVLRLWGRASGGRGAYVDQYENKR